MVFGLFAASIFIWVNDSIPVYWNIQFENRKMVRSQASVLNVQHFYSRLSKNTEILQNLITKNYLSSKQQSTERRNSK
jgi:hypothetical protein